jgi:hypothetical protein
VKYFKLIISYLFQLIRYCIYINLVKVLVRYFYYSKYLGNNRCTRVRVGLVANLCVIRSGMMHLTLTYEMCGFRIVHRILDSLRMTIVACYLVFGSCVSFVHDFSSVTLLFSGTPISDV